MIRVSGGSIQMCCLRFMRVLGEKVNKHNHGGKWIPPKSRVGVHDSRDIKLTVNPLTMITLPEAKFGGRIIICNTREEESIGYSLLKNETLLGFDTETKPVVLGQPKRTALIQLCSESVCLIWRVTGRHTLSSCLSDILCSRNVIKACQGASQEIISLHRYFGVRCDGFVDLHEMAVSLGCTPRSLAGLCAIFLGKRLFKSTALSDWERPNLSRDQIIYAATDAWVSRNVLLAMREYVKSRECSKEIERVIDPNSVGLTPCIETTCVVNNQKSSNSVDEFTMEGRVVATSRANGSDDKKLYSSNLHKYDTETYLNHLLRVCDSLCYDFSMESLPDPASKGGLCFYEITLRNTSTSTNKIEIGSGVPKGVLKARSMRPRHNMVDGQEDAAKCTLVALRELGYQV